MENSCFKRRRRLEVLNQTIFYLFLLWPPPPPFAKRTRNPLLSFYGKTPFPATTYYHSPTTQNKKIKTAASYKKGKGEKRKSGKLRSELTSYYPLSLFPCQLFFLFLFLYVREDGLGERMGLLLLLLFLGSYAPGRLWACFFPFLFGRPIIKWCHGQLAAEKENVPKSQHLNIGHCFFLLCTFGLEVKNY